MFACAGDKNSEHFFAARLFFAHFGAQFFAAKISLITTRCRNNSCAFRLCFRGFFRLRSCIFGADLRIESINQMVNS
jgi:hypothetical protein